MKIFINYRQLDTPWPADYLADKLKDAFGESNVFIDERKIDVGDRIKHEINSALSTVKVLIVLIGSKWLFSHDSSGRRRIDGSDDWVKHEIKECLNRDECLVIPILLEGAALPSKKDLPGEIQGLADCKAIKISKENRALGVEGLIKRANRHLSGNDIETTKSTPSKIIYEKLSQYGKLNLSDFKNPYNHVFDTESWSERKVFCAICFPKIDLLKNAPKSAQIPAVALCFDSSYKVDIKSLMDEVLYSKFQQYSPGKLFNKDKVKILKSLSPIFDNVFIAGVTLPALLFSSKVNKRKYRHTYAALINSLIYPLLSYHESIEYTLENIEVAPIGSASHDVNLLSVLNSEIEPNISHLENEEIGSIIRMLAWCIGAAVNSDNLEWIDIIKEG